MTSGGTGPQGLWLRKACRAFALVVIGILVVVAVPSAQAPVDFKTETHFRCYVVSQQTPQGPEPFTLSDQFAKDAAFMSGEPLMFCAPTSKNGQRIEKPEEHLTMYPAEEKKLADHLLVQTQDQFGKRTLEVVNAEVLLVPTQKLVGNLRFPSELNHYWCWAVRGERARLEVTLKDQFSGPDTVRVEHPALFCNPVKKVHDGKTFNILEKDVHLTCYDIFAPKRTEATQFGVKNQFEQDTFTVTSFQLLCVPSAKLSVQPR